MGRPTNGCVRLGAGCLMEGGCAPGLAGGPSAVWGRRDHDCLMECGMLRAGAALCVWLFGALVYLCFWFIDRFYKLCQVSTSFRVTCCYDCILRVIAN